ncbi:ShlB/FhaC/HecB family hemolysin secretion/activation protein [soil metagenome]
MTRSKLIIGLVLASLTAVDFTAAQAQTLAQGPGQVLPQSAQPAPAAGSFVLRGVTFKGATQLSSAELMALTTGRIGRPVTMTDLDSIAKGVADLYHERGFFLAKVFVPVQEVKDGVVEISVVEGAVNRVIVRLAKDAPISQDRVTKMLEPLRPGKPLDGNVYERTVLMLSDMPGIAVQSGLEEGEQPGSVNLVIDIQAARRFAASVEADNSGTEESGRERIGVNARLASPLGIGDNLDARLQLSRGASLWFGRLAYEAPIGYEGLRAGVGVARAHYDLGADFEDLDANGTSTVYDVSMTYPLLRSRSQNVFLRAWVDRKNLSDNLDAFDYRTNKRVNGYGIGLSSELRDNWLGGGYWNITTSAYAGDLHLRDDLSSAIDASIFGRQTSGNFVKTTAQVSRLQALFARNSLFVSVGGQYTTKNLDPSEKLALGGSRAVRACSSNEALVDQGGIATVEYRYALFDSMSVYGFRDMGWGQLLHDRQPGDRKSAVLRANGLGFTWSVAGDFTVSSTVAWRDTDPGVTDGGDKNPRFYWQLQKLF